MTAPQVRSSARNGNMKKFDHLRWCGAIFFAALIVPGLSYAGGALTDPSSPRPYADLNLASATVPAPTQVVQEESSPAEASDSGYAGPGTLFPDSAAATSTPDAKTLLPCPLSVPCRVDSTDDGVRPPAESLRMADIPAANGVRQMKQLLPCPLSVPCIAEPPSQKEEPARRTYRPVHRRATKTIKLHAAKPVEKPAEARLRPVSNPAPAAPSAPAVTLQGSSVLRMRAQRSLEESDQKLAAIDPMRLAGEQAVTYEQANRLLAAGHAALNGQDYLTALGLGSKASRLIAMLPAQPARQASRGR
jgi:hypothetical protein